MSCFTTNEIVWAKVKGYPWWPAMIIKIKENKNAEYMRDIVVNFIGENSHATLPEDKIAHFTEKFKQFSAGKSKKLQESIKAALKMSEQMTSYEAQPKNHSAAKGRHSQESVIKPRSREHRSRGNSKRKESLDERESAKSGRPRKQKGKEEETLIYDHLLDFIPHRVTRQQMKSQHMEVPTEPLIYNLSRKSGYRNNKSKEKGSEMEIESLRTYGCESRKASTDIPFEKVQGSVEDCGRDETKLGSTSSADSFNNGVLSDDSQPDAERVRDKKAVESQFNRNKKLVVSQFQDQENSNVLAGSQNKGNTEGLLVKTQEKEGDCGEKADPPLPLVHKSEFSATRVASECSVSDNLEHELDGLMNKFIARFKNPEILVEHDEDIIKLLSLVDEFQKLNFSGYDLISSNLGKLFKTIHYLFIKNKHTFNKTGNAVLSVLAKILHQIKDKILKYCLDNTAYVESLHLSVDKQENPHQHTITVPAVEIEEIKTKIEEFASESDHRCQVILEDPLSITTKVEDEELPEKIPKEQCVVSKVQTISNLHEIPTLSLNHAMLSSCSQNGSKGDCRTKSNNQSHNLNHNNNHHHHGTTILLRKKACQRLSKMVQESYKVDKEKSQEITLMMEGKIYGMYTDSNEEYKESIKNIYKIIKLRMISLDELHIIKQMDNNAFDLVIKQKFESNGTKERGLELLGDNLEMLSFMREDSRNSNIFTFSPKEDSKTVFSDFLAPSNHSSTQVKETKILL